MKCSYCEIDKEIGKLVEYEKQKLCLNCYTIEKRRLKKIIVRSEINRYIDCLGGRL